MHGIRLSREGGLIYDQPKGLDHQPIRYDLEEEACSDTRQGNHPAACLVWKDILVIPWTVFLSSLPVGQQNLKEHMLGRPPENSCHDDWDSLLYNDKAVLLST